MMQPFYVSFATDTCFSVPYPDNPYIEWQSMRLVAFGDDRWLSRCCRGWFGRSTGLRVGVSTKPEQLGGLPEGSLDSHTNALQAVWGRAYVQVEAHLLRRRSWGRRFGARKERMIRDHARSRPASVEVNNIPHTMATPVHEPVMTIERCLIAVQATRIGQSANIATSMPLVE